MLPSITSLSERATFVPLSTFTTMMLPQLEGRKLLFGTTASCGLGFMLFGKYPPFVYDPGKANFM